MITREITNGCKPYCGKKDSSDCSEVECSTDFASEPRPERVDKFVGPKAGARKGTGHVIARDMRTSLMRDHSSASQGDILTIHHKLNVIVMCNMLGNLARALDPASDDHPRKMGQLPLVPRRVLKSFLRHL